MGDVLPPAGTQPCRNCGQSADSVGLDDRRLYCSDCVFDEKVPQQRFEWLPEDGNE